MTWVAQELAPWLVVAFVLGVVAGVALSLTRVSGEIFNSCARCLGSRSSPYSTRRKSRREALVFSRKLTKLLIATVHCVARSLSLSCTAAA